MICDQIFVRWTVSSNQIAFSRIVRVARSRRKALGVGMTSYFAMNCVVLVPELTFRLIPHMLWGPEVESLGSCCVEPITRFILILGECPAEVFALDYLPYKGERSIKLVSFEKINTCYSKLARDLHNAGKANHTLKRILHVRILCFGWPTRDSVSCSEKLEAIVI